MDYMKQFINAISNGSLLATLIAIFGSTTISFSVISGIFSKWLRKAKKVNTELQKQTKELKADIEIVGKELSEIKTQLSKNNELNAKILKVESIAWQNSNINNEVKKELQNQLTNETNIDNIEEEVKQSNTTISETIQEEVSTADFSAIEEIENEINDII